MTRLISHEYIEAESKNSVTYFIEIDRFRETCMGVKADDIFSSEKFFINWSEFSVGLYGGYEENDGFGGLRIFVTNHSDWMVKARMSISVGNSSSGLHMSSREKVLKSVAGNASERSLNVYDCVPFSRCTTKDLLTRDGALEIRVRVDLMAENIPAGRSNDDVHQSELSEVKAQLNLLKGQLRQVEAKVGLDGSVHVETEAEPAAGYSSQVKCPVCMKRVVRPMRLHQCPRVRLLGNVLLHLISHSVRATSSVMTATPTSTTPPVMATRSSASPASPSTVDVLSSSRVSWVSWSPVSSLTDV